MTFSIRTLFAQTSKIRILRPSEDAELLDEDMSKIYAYWNKFHKNAKLYDGCLCNFKHLKILDADFEIATEKVMYAAFFARQSIKLSDHARTTIQPLTVGAVTKTADGKLIVGKRGENMVAARKVTPLPQGFVAANMIEAVIDPEEVLTNRLHMELNVPRHLIDRLIPGGLIRDEIYGHVMLVFFAYLSDIKSYDVIEMWKEAKEQELNAHIWLIECQKNEVRDFLVGQYDKLTGDAIGSFLLFGRNEFGYKWYRDSIERLIEIYDFFEPLAFYT